MRSPALAIGWAFGRRHRWGLIALSVYMLALALIKVIYGPGHRVNFEDDQSFAIVVIVPLSATFMYFLAVFSFGLDGDLAARESMYPRRMFTLPVTTGALAGWPMLYGCAAMAILWLGTRLLGVWPADVHVPLFWPLLLGPAFLAWAQALTWMPYPLRGMRVIVTVLSLTVFEAHVFTALELKVRESVMVAILAPHVPLAYLVARFAVGKARRGDVPDWGRFFARLGNIAGGLTRPRTDFSSAARAQQWFEWRQHGRSLPWLIALLLPFELALLFPFRETPVIIFEVLVLVLLSPPFMALFVAANVSMSNPHGGDSYGVPPFLATRPLTNASLIGAKLKVTIWSTLVTWLLVLIAVPIALQLSGTWPVVLENLPRFVDFFGTPRAVAVGLLIFLALVTSTWKQLVQSLYIGMSGREWIVKGSVFVALSFLAILFPLGNWVLHSRSAILTVWKALPWIAAVLVCLKLSAAVWIAARLHDQRLLSDRTLVMGAIFWDVLVFGLYGVLVWIVPMMLVRTYFVALLAILAVPLARVSAAPLALAWNRHR